MPRTNKVSRTGISVRVTVLPPPEPMTIKVVSDEADTNTLKGEFLKPEAVRENGGLGKSLLLNSRTNEP